MFKCLFNLNKNKCLGQSRQFPHGLASFDSFNSSLFSTKRVKELYLFCILKTWAKQRGSNKRHCSLLQLHHHNLQNIFHSQPYRPGVSKIRGILSSRGSFTISRKAVMPIWPRPMSSCRSRWQPNFPSEK